MDEKTAVDMGFLSTLAAGAVGVWAWATVFFGVKSKVDRHDERLDSHDEGIALMRTEMRADVKAIHEKLDRIIERGR